MDFPTAIEIDNNSNIIVTGYSLESAPPTYIYDYATIKYNSSLSQQWAMRFDGTGNGDNKPAALAVDNSGNIYVTGYSTGSLSSYDYLTIKYNSSGSVDTMLRINGNANMNGYASTIVVGPNSTIYVTGSAYFTGSGLDYYTLRYSLDPLLAVPLSNEVPEQFVLSQNYPNPFNPSTAIKFDIPKSSPVKLSVFDVTGREIEVLVNENLSAGSYSVSWDAGKVSSGIYFYRLTAGDFVQTKKMMLIK